MYHNLFDYYERHIKYVSLQTKNSFNFLKEILKQNLILYFQCKSKIVKNRKFQMHINNIIKSKTYIFSKLYFIY